MRAQIRYRSFLVRIWSEPDAGFPAAHLNWQGEVEHVQSGQRWAFDRMDALLEFLEGQGEDDWMTTDDSQ